MAPYSIVSAFRRASCPELNGQREHPYSERHAHENGFFFPVFRFTILRPTPLLRSTFLSIAAPSTVTINGAGYDSYGPRHTTPGSLIRPVFRLGRIVVHMDARQWFLPNGLGLSSGGLLSELNRGWRFTFVLQATDTRIRRTRASRSSSFFVTGLTITTTSTLPIY